MGKRLPEEAPWEHPASEGLRVDTHEGKPADAHVAASHVPLRNELLLLVHHCALVQNRLVGIRVALFHRLEHNLRDTAKKYTSSGVQLHPPDVSLRAAVKLHLAQRSAKNASVAPRCQHDACLPR